MRHLPHHPRFRTLLATALALAGCGNKADPDPITPAPEPAPAITPPPLVEPGASCEDAAGPPIGDDLAPVESVDAAALLVRPQAGRGGGPARLEPAVGQICDDGTVTCVVDMIGESGLRSECHQIGCFDVSLVWSRGGERGVANDRDALLAFLGPIDSAGDARTMVWVEGFQPTSCAPATGEDGSWTVNATKMVSDCPIQVDAFDFRVAADGTVEQVAHRPGEATNMCIGRLPPGLADMLPVDASVSSWLARAAHLEAASVHAFQQLHTELVHYGAPVELCDAALACAADEVRHADIMTALAEAAGATVPAPAVHDTPVRSLVAIARDNAAEGCGREAWGALVGLWQAEHAERGDVRAAMREIAADEVRHAEFSLALDAWLKTQLTSTEIARVDRTQRKARARLAAEAQIDVPPAVRGALGLPSPDQATVLWSALAA